jgi:hypothetical protein
MSMIIMILLMEKSVFFMNDSGYVRSVNNR